MADRTATHMRFLKDTAQHVVTVVHDCGVHRHLRCQRPGTNVMSFDVVTYPGYLCYSGDMGCFVFWRIPDMFEFFRGGKSRGDELTINPGYWAEKLQADGVHEGHKEFSQERFRAAVKESVAEASDLSAGTKASIVERLEREVFNHLSDGEGPARVALRYFVGGQGLFDDFWERNCQEYTGRFLWCCYAIVWAIREYDAIKAAPRG